MTSNPAAAVRMLVIYSICIPLAALVGYLLCDTLDYGSLGIFAVIAGLLISPLIIKYHYPLMVFGLGAPIYCFFLKGNPPLMQVVVMLSLGIAIIDRTLNSDRKFISIPMMTWPLLFAFAVTYMTAELTGGIGLKALGGSVSGGKKYLALFIGIAMYFALTSRVIPKKQRGLYIGIFFLSGLPAFVGDIFPFLPSPLNYVNLLIPPSDAGMSGDVSFGTTRLGAFATTASVVANYMLARYGLRGIFDLNRPMRFLAFFLLLVLTMLGGFRVVVISYICILTMLFFLEGLYRTQMSLVVVFGLVIGATIIVPFSDKLPTTFQRALSFVPFLKIDSAVMADAEGSKLWREKMWEGTWPKVPQYLLLGKGYSLTAEDFQMMGDGAFANRGIDTGDESLAISGDYHNGPLSTLMPFGIWGAIAFFWVSLTALFILIRNYRYGDAELKTVNALLLIMMIQKFWGFFFIFGAYSSDLGTFGEFAGFSIALNWRVCGPPVKAYVTPRINRTLKSEPLIA